MPGPIALVGSGEFTPAMEAIDLEVLDGRPRRVVFLPTAAAEEGEDTVRYWLDLGVEHYERLGIEPVPLRVLTKDDANDASLAARVAGAGLVYLSGGNPGYLAETLRGTAVARAILDLWEGGAALAGCSAGAAALTALAHDVQAEGFPAREGLKVVPNLFVLAHFDRLEEWVPGIVKRALREAPDGVRVVGIDEETALVGRPGNWVVRGRQRVWLVERDGARRAFEPGARVPLPA